MAHPICLSFTITVIFFLFTDHIKSSRCILFHIHPTRDNEKPIWPSNWKLLHLQKIIPTGNETAHGKRITELPRTGNAEQKTAIQRLVASASSVNETAQDSSHFPFQYNIEIRKRHKKVSTAENKVPVSRGPVHYKAEETGEDHGKGIREGREKHVDRDLEVNKYRMVENKEEEHWHEKKWHKEDLKEEYADGKPVPGVKVKIFPKYNGAKQSEQRAAKDSHLPFYARPLDAHASRHEVDEHFSVPSPGFRVDKSFESWVRKNFESVSQ